jgi:hypothetical protein
MISGLQMDQRLATSNSDAFWGWFGRFSGYNSHVCRLSAPGHLWRVPGDVSFLWSLIREAVTPMPSFHTKGPSLRFELGGFTSI